MPATATTSAMAATLRSANVSSAAPRQQRSGVAGNGGRARTSGHGYAVFLSQRATSAYCHQERPLPVTTHLAPNAGVFQRPTGRPGRCAHAGTHEEVCTNSLLGVCTRQREKSIALPPAWVHPSSCSSALTPISLAPPRPAPGASGRVQAHRCTLLCGPSWLLQPAGPPAAGQRAWTSARCASGRSSPSPGRSFSRPKRCVHWRAAGRRR